MTILNGKPYILRRLFRHETHKSLKWSLLSKAKSEAVLLSTTQHARASSSPLTDVNVAGCIVPLTDTVKLLGVTIIDCHYFNIRLTCTEHIQVCVFSYTDFEAHPLIPFHRHGETVASALVNWRLDYANSVMYNTSSANMLKRQTVQNSLARVVTYTKRVEHIHPVRRQLQCLPINYRINYKVATLAY